MKTFVVGTLLVTRLWQQTPQMNHEEVSEMLLKKGVVEVRSIKPLFTDFEKVERVYLNSLDDLSISAEACAINPARFKNRTVCVEDVVNKGLLLCDNLGTLIEKKNRIESVLDKAIVSIRRRKISLSNEQSLLLKEYMKESKLRIRFFDSPEIEGKRHRAITLFWKLREKFGY